MRDPRTSPADEDERRACADAAGRACALGRHDALLAALREGLAVGRAPAPILKLQDALRRLVRDQRRMGR